MEVGMKTWSGWRTVGEVDEGRDLERWQYLYFIFLSVSKIRKGGRRTWCSIIQSMVSLKHLIPTCQFAVKYASFTEYKEFQQKAWFEREHVALSTPTLSPPGTVISPHQCCVHFLSSHSFQNLLEFVLWPQTVLGLCSQDFCDSLNLKCPTQTCVLEHMVPSWSQSPWDTRSTHCKVGHQVWTPRVIASFPTWIFVSWPEATDSLELQLPRT